MIYTYKESIYIEGSRAFIIVPFNVWEETGSCGVANVDPKKTVSYMEVYAG